MKGSFKIFKIRHISGAEVTIGADSAQEVCWKMGWQIDDCQVGVVLNPDGQPYYPRCPN